MSNFNYLSLIGVNDSNGLDAEQTLVYGAGNLILWFDPSETSTYLGPSYWNENVLAAINIQTFVERAQTARVYPESKFGSWRNDSYIDFDVFCRRGVNLNSTYFGIQSNIPDASLYELCGLELTSPTPLKQYTAMAVLNKLPQSGGCFWLFGNNSSISDYTSPPEAMRDYAMSLPGGPTGPAWETLWATMTGVYLINTGTGIDVGISIPDPSGSGSLTVKVVDNYAVPDSYLVNGKLVFSVRHTYETDNVSRLTAYINEHAIGYIEDTYDDATDKHTYSSPTLASSVVNQFGLASFTRLSTFGTDVGSLCGEASPNASAIVLGDVLFYNGEVTENKFIDVLNWLKVKWFTPRPKFGALQNNLGVMGQAFSSTFELTNADKTFFEVQASVLDEQDNITPVGSNWEVSPFTSTHWSLSGQFPPTATSFLIKIHAGPDPYFGVDQYYRLIATVDGALNANDAYVYSFDQKLAVWLDPSEPSTLYSNGPQLNGIRDRATTYDWWMRSSETITSDTTTFTVPGISFSDAEYSDGFDTSISLIPQSCDPLFQSYYQRNQVFQGVPLGTDSSTLVMVLSVETPNAFETFKSFGAFANTRLTQVGIPGDGMAWLDVDWTALGAWFTAIDPTSSGGGATSVILADNAVDGALGNSYNQKYLTNSPDAGLLPPTRAVVTFRIKRNATNDGYVVTLRYNGIERNVAYYIGGEIGGVNSTDDDFHPPLFIGAFGSPGGYVLGSVGEIIAFNEALSDSDLMGIEQYLKRKWFDAANNPPVIGAISKTSVFASSIYDATVSISNGTGNVTTATVVSTGGGNWNISKVSATDETLWRVTGTSPSLAGQFTLTITGTIDGQTTSKDFVINSLAKPPMPEFGALKPPQAATGVAYNGTVTIENMTTVGSSGVSIASSAGSGWTISVDANDPTKYHVVGTMPSSPGTFNLTITAVNTNADNTIATTTQGVFPLHAVKIQTARSSRYPLDLTGLLASNKIKNEEHTLTAENGPDRQMIVPIMAPFFGESLEVYYYDASISPKKADLHLDYVPVCEFQQLSNLCKTKVFGAIGFLNTSITGRVIITYQTIGGDFVIDRNKLYEELANQIANPRQIDMSAIVDIPAYLPVDSHEHDFNTDLVGFGGAISKLSETSSTSVSKQTPTDVEYMSTHVTIKGDPHSLTPEQIGLGNVNNFPPATIDQAVDSTNETTYLTPMTASAAGKANLRNASASVSGIAPLNLGTKTGDDNNATDALTAAGIMALMTSKVSNVFKQEFSGGQVVAKVSPYSATPTTVTVKRNFNVNDSVVQPVIVTETQSSRLHFPLYWRGLKYNTLAEFISGVETFVDIYPLTFDENIGAFYFPQGSTPPDLTTSSTKNVSSYRKKSISDPVNYPLSVPRVTTAATEVVTTTVIRRITVVDPVTSKLIVTETITT